MMYKEFIGKDGLIKEDPFRGFAKKGEMVFVIKKLTYKWKLISDNNGVRFEIVYDVKDFDSDDDFYKYLISEGYEVPVQRV